MLGSLKFAVAVSAGSLLAGLLFAYQAQEWRYGRRLAQIDAAQKQAAINAVEAARIQEREHVDRVNAAIKRARQDEQAARRASELAVSELDSLRHASAGSLARAQASREAALDSAAALDAVFRECAAELRAVALAADLHAADVRQLIDSFPASKKN